MIYRFYKTPKNRGRIGTFYKTDGEEVWTLDNKTKEWIWLPPEMFRMIGEKIYFQHSILMTEKEMFIEII